MLSTKPPMNGVDLARVGKIGQQLRDLVEQLAGIFPERESLLQQILYALLTKEHVLVFGTFGTGKSDLLHTLFDSFTGSRVFSIALTKFMSEANVIGIPDPSRLRDSGEVHYRRDGGILDADFAELDELLDSNAPLLRVLLGILNERQFKRGRQVEDANLHTAVACTNGIPDEEIKKHPELGAVLDRFLFQCSVGYLQTAESRHQMYRKYLSGAQPTVKIELADLKFISGVVTDANQIKDEYLVQVYDRIVTAYCEQAKLTISDRRRCKLLQLAEANALLYGRYDVDLEDLLAVKWGLCRGGNVDGLKKFDEVAKPIMDKAKAERPQSVDEVQNKLLDELQAKAPAMPTKCDNGQLVDICRQVVALIKDVEGVKPQLPSTCERQKKLLKDLTDRKSQIMTSITAG